MSDNPGTSRMPARPGWFSETAETLMSSLQERQISGLVQPQEQFEVVVDVLEALVFATLEVANALHRMAES